MRLDLYRDEDTGIATLGRLYAEDEFIAYTLENTWLDNLSGLSCIPPGCYNMTTKRYGWVWDRYKKPVPILLGVEPRTEILIHPGNYAKDTLGCILVGDSKGTNAVWNSRRTWNFILPTLQVATEITIHQV